MARKDYLDLCERVGLPLGPTVKEWATAFGKFWECLAIMVYWDRRAKEYWW